jgi:hypothetical protein
VRIDPDRIVIDPAVVLTFPEQTPTAGGLPDWSHKALVS